MAKGLFDRYIWLIDTIYRAGKITFEEINKRWLRTEMSNGEEIPLRTFHNHRKAIETMFDINIECNKRAGYYYYIENADDIDKDKIKKWLLNTFTINNLANESHRLKQRILFEDIPSGKQYLSSIIEAMLENRIIEITYQSYWKEEANTFTIEPFCVKVFKQRWYIIARSPYYDTIMIYALDRIQNLQVMDITFNYPSDFDPQSYFEFSFGIVVDEICNIDKIRIKVYGKKCQYIKALPLHHSQSEVETTKSYSIFEYLLKPTYDFCQELLSHGDEIEVLSPTSLKEQIKEIVKNMSRYYN